MKWLCWLIVRKECNEYLIKIYVNQKLQRQNLTYQIRRDYSCKMIACNQRLSWLPPEIKHACIKCITYASVKVRNLCLILVSNFIQLGATEQLVLRRHYILINCLCKKKTLKMMRFYDKEKRTCRLVGLMHIVI